MIPVVRLYPGGGFGVVSANDITDIPAVKPGWHDRFGTFREACAAAQGEPGGDEFLVHAEVL